MSNLFDKFTDFILRVLHARETRTQQAGASDENGKFAALSTMGEAQPVARLLENSEDIAEQYSKSFPHICRAQGCRNSRLRGAGDYCGDHVGLISYSKVSEREQAGSRKENLFKPKHTLLSVIKDLTAGLQDGTVVIPPTQSEPQKVRPPAPKKYRELLCVDTACETIFDSNRWGDQVCLREGVGICKFCGSIVCKPCVTFEFCPNAPCGQSKHLVIVQ